MTTGSGSTGSDISSQEAPTQGFTSTGGSRDVPGWNALEIVEGLHAGASAELDEHCFTIGSSTESDIVLHDEGIAPVHLRLNRRGGIIEIEAIGGDVVLPDGQIIPQGHGRRCKLPLEASIGGARIRLTGPAPSNAVPSASKRPLFAAAGLAIAAFAVTAMANGLSPEKSDKARNDLLTGSRNQRPANTAPVAGDASDAEERLRLRLEQAGIGALDIKQASGRLIASGTIPEHQGKAWTEIQSWFDRTYSDRALLVSNVSIGDVAQPPRLVLQAIWYGERPYIIAADGSRYYEGAFTDDGWIIEKIGEKELLLSKGSAKVALKYP